MVAVLVGKWRGRKGDEKGFAALIIWRERSQRTTARWDGRAEGWGNDRDRCPPPYSVRKGCDVSRVNLTLIRRVINGRVVFIYICIYIKVYAVCIRVGVKYMSCTVIVRLLHNRDRRSLSRNLFGISRCGDVFMCTVETDVAKVVLELCCYKNVKSTKTNTINIKYPCFPIRLD